MKYLYSLCLTFFVLSSSNSGLAQQLVTTTNTSSPSSCDGTAYFAANAAYGPPYWTWSWYADSSQLTLADTSTSLANLCSGNYYLVLDSMGTQYWNPFTIGNPCSNFSYTADYNGCTPNNCDGNISFYPTGGSAPYTYSWSNAVTTQNQMNLCPGVYTINCSDSYGCVQTVSFNISQDSLQYLTANLYAIDDYNTNCTGYAWVSPTGGTAPYMVNWSTGDTTNYIDGLCAGIYSVTIWDSNSDSTSVSFIIADSTNTYGNDPYPNDPVNDTLYSYLVTNCEIDYNEIDSASLYQAVYDSVGQNLYVTWVVYTSTDTTYINDTLGLSGNPGVYSITISVYCPNKSINDFFKIQGKVYFDGSTISMLIVEENSLESINIYPNPFSNSISFDNKDGAIQTLKMVDLNGRIISEMNHLNSGSVELKQLDNVSSGSYLLILSGADTFKTYKVIKN